MARHRQRYPGERDPPLPEGFRRTFLGEADLARAFAMLEGCEHFFAEAMRGRIRSMQLRLEEAWDHFDRAADLSEEVEETIPNLVRRFLLEIYSFDHAVVDSPVPPEALIPASPLPPLLPSLFEQYPELKLVLDLRKFCQAKLLLHLGQCKRAAVLYRELIADNRDDPPEFPAMYYLGLAACQHGQGLLDDALRSLENAGLATVSMMSLDPSDPERARGQGSRLNAAWDAATLSVFYRFLGDDDTAAGWRAFLGRLSCPSETRDAFARRAERLLERCFEHTQLVTF